MRYQTPRGTKDVLPSESHRWRFLESKFRDLVHHYGYQEIRTPSFEDTDLFVRSSGETSDIVSKQMYTFNDKGDRSMTLKPEGTAPAMRSVIEHNLCPSGSVARLYYVTPIFRYERPMKGRYREAHQVGLELVGSNSVLADAEIVDITVRFYEAIGLPEVEVLLNSLGRQECRAKYREVVLEYAEAYLKDQPDDVRDKARKNPLRLLDSKDPDVQKALEGIPPVLNYLEPESKAQFERLQELLTLAKVPYRVAPEVVRGLDYYTGTVFEVQSTKLGSQNSLCGGGRYDDLIKEMGGPATPSVGVAMGMERALIVLEESGIEPVAVTPDVFMVVATPEATDAALALAAQLRANGISTVIDPDTRSLKSQLRQADRSGAKFATILGADELANGTVTLRNLANSEQVAIASGEVVQKVKQS